MMNSILPLASGARGRTKNIGRSADIIAGQSRTLVEVLGNDETGTYLTAVLVGPVEVTPGDFAGRQLDARAIIEWGNAGVQAQADVDFLNGQAITVPGSFLRVRGANDEEAGEGGSIRVGAFVGYFQRAFPPAQRTISISSLAAGASTTYDLPHFAAELFVHRDPISRSVDVEFMNAGALIGTAFVPAGENSGLILIPNGTQTVRVRNDGASAINLLRMVHRLYI